MSWWTQSEGTSASSMFGQNVFPMMTVPLQTLLDMSRMQSHEALLTNGLLEDFREEMGQAMFVSHQWVTPDHHPNLEQLHVLQQALENLRTGQCRVTLPPVIELSVGRLKCPRAADFTKRPLYIWFDYFSVPQATSSEAELKRRLAIGLIPSYVARSSFFVTLVPLIRLQGDTLGSSTWGERGWCRLEYLASQFRHEGAWSIIIKGASQVTLAHDVNGICKAPGTGRFAFEQDRIKVGHVTLELFRRQLQALLDCGKLHEYRFLFSLQRVYAEGFSLSPVQSPVPNFQTEIEPSTDPDGFQAAQFLHNSLFAKVSDRDQAGWTPLCYAVLTNQVPLVRALLKMRADINDRTTKSKKGANLPKNLPVLSLATAFHSNDVLQFLLSENLQVNARCGLSCTALTWAGEADNGPAVQLLLEARVNPLLKAFPDASPFRAACGCGSVQAMQEMLLHMRVNLRYCLHTALALHGECESISFLVHARADVNETLRIPMRKTAWWGLMKVLTGLHYFSPSDLTYLAYHHAGATPLVFSILTGKWDTIPILLCAGARLDIPTRRGKTAADFLAEFQVPSAFSNFGRGRVSSCDSSVTISI